MSYLYYVIGPSGAGKDSILNAARKRLESGGDIAFAHRYITRPADAGGENHVALSIEAFQARKKRGLFCMHWESHGLCYGLGVEIERWLDAGLSVVMNGSRGFLHQATERFEDALIPVSIEVDGAILRQRLKQRGRENGDEIEQRVQRASAFKIEHPRLVRIENNGLLDDAVATFCEHMIHESGHVTVS